MGTIERLKQLPGADLLRPAWRVAHPLREGVKAMVFALRRRRTPQLLAQHDRLHLGCGGIRLEGWANIDSVGWDTVNWDLRKPLPIGEPRIRFVYAEHFIEHISRADGLKLLRSLRAILVEGGVVRLSTPDLAFFASAYLKGRVVGAPDFDWNPDTPCRMLNDQMRLWGHQYLYDERELRALLGEAGFSSVARVDWRQSSVDALCGLESRPDMGDLILEAS